MNKQPEYLEIVKVIPKSPLVRVVIAKDNLGRLWKRVEGFGESEWEIYKPSQV